VGEMSLVDSSGRSANVVTTEPSRLLWMDRATFQTCLRTLTPLANNLVRLLAHRLRFANEQIQALCTLDVPGRVARQILAMADRYGSPEEGDEVRIPIRLTQSDLAEIVGASRERVNQVIVDLKQRGLISVDPVHRIHVHNRRELARYCQ
jgi:CRP/FNR family cyclic AMP-dependent transcriptional regulator